MIGDKLNILPEYFQLYTPIADDVLKSHANSERFVILIGGESGSGKSVLSTCIAQLLEEQNINCSLIQLDDYFKLPPTTNHKQREQNLSNVGVHEVNMELLQQHIDIFLENKTSYITKPLSSHETNTISAEHFNLEGVKALIIEGTYALYLQHAAYRIYINRDYISTKANRIARSRDIIDEFSEKVLAIEHRLVTKSATDIDCTIQNDYTLTF
ncbi:MAG: zeta toxin family protein [Saprospiraceae bacterium]|nr:zeta toxin family protein [Saprospiraceae bacterium]